MLLLASIAPLEACSAIQPRTQYLACPVPDSELACMTAPKTPSTGTDLDDANYILELRLAGADCRAKLATVKEILDGCRRKH
jgi:hypothetical protein